MTTQRTTPLRVLHVTPRVAPYVGGVETHVYEVVRRLPAHGVEAAVLTTDPGDDLPRFGTLGGVPVERVRAWPRGRDLMIAPELPRRLRTGGWDVVHVQSYHTFVAPLAMATAARAGMPYVLTFHGGGHSSPVRTAIRRPQLEVLRPLLARAHALVSIAEFERDHYGRRLRLRPERFVTIPNGADLPVPTDAGVARETETLIMSVGRLERYKGHHRAIRALPHIIREVPDARLWIAGSGPYADTLTALARRLGVANRVEIRAGNRNELADGLSRASLSVLLSDFESQPLAALEAASLGVPVVVAYNSGLAELADRGIARAVRLADSPRAHAAVMLEQLRAPRRTTPVELPSWDDCALALARLYRAVAESGPRGVRGAQRRMA